MYSDTVKINCSLSSKTKAYSFPNDDGGWRAIPKDLGKNWPVVSSNTNLI